MAKGRKNGCPMNIKNWIVEILAAADTWVRIHGMNSLDRGIESETEDGSAETDAWAEPFKTKLSGSLTLEGKPVVDQTTGARDEGQELLEEFAKLTGCDADCTIRMFDPYGHGMVADYIVTSYSENADDSENGLSVDLEMVGEPEALPYVQTTAIALKQNGSAATTLSMAVGDAPKLIAVDFTPATASNKRFKVTNTKRSVATVTNVTEAGFSIVPVSVGTATITVTSINNTKTATLTVTVTAGT